MNTSLHQRVATHPFFAGLAPEHLQIITTQVTDRVYQPGEIIFRENEPANRLFLIETGKVIIEAQTVGGGALPVQTLGAGETLGWSWLYPPFVWNFQARAGEITSVIVVDGGHLLVAAEADRAFGYELMRRVAKIVIHRLQAARKQVLQQAIESAYEG